MYKVGTKVVHKTNPWKGVGEVVKVVPGDIVPYKVAFPGCTAWFYGTELKRYWNIKWSRVGWIAAYVLLWVTIILALRSW